MRRFPVRRLRFFAGLRLWAGEKGQSGFQERPTYREVLFRLNQKDLAEQVEQLLTGEFDVLFSERRKRFVVSCVRKRLGYYGEAIKV